MADKKQSGGLNTEDNGIYGIETPEQKKKRERAAKGYTEYNPLDVINNPYGKESQYLKEARDLKFAPPEKEDTGNSPKPEWSDKLGRQLDFMEKYVRINEMQSPEVVTPTDIYKSGYSDLYYGKDFLYDPRDMPENLDKVRYELNKNDNFKKAIKMFGRDAFDGFVKSAKSIMIWRAFGAGNFEGEVDKTGTIDDFLLNGYTGIVNDPEKAGKKFTKEYWLQQLASMGTTLGMGAEFLTEALLFKGASKVLSSTNTARKISASSKLSKREKVSNGVKDAFEAEEKAAALGRADKSADANKILNETPISAQKLIERRDKQLTKDITTGSLIGIRNATLNYQFNYNDVYSDVINAGGSEEEAIEKATAAARNTFQMEVAASVVLNIMQTQLIHSISDSKFKNMQRNLEAAVSGGKISEDGIKPISTKGLFWKNAGKFGLSVIEEGLEEVMEDGLAMIGREKAYKNDWERWNDLGLQYRASDNYNQLFDSFIGGVLGGGVFSGARAGLNAAMGKSETKLRRTEIEMYNKLADQFNKNFTTEAMSLAKKNKELSILQDDYKKGKDIEIGKKKYSSKKADGTTNPEYKEAFERRKKEIELENTKHAATIRAVQNAASAIEMMSLMSDNSASEFALQNVKMLREQAEILENIGADEDTARKLFESAQSLQDLIDEIETLEGEEKVAKEEEYNKLNESFGDDAKLVESMRQNLDIFGSKDDRKFDFDKIKEQKDIVDSQLLVTNVFNHAFYNYYAGFNDNMHAAIKYATNEANSIAISIGISNVVDDVLDSMDDVFLSITKKVPDYFTRFGNERFSKLAFAYNFFKGINSNGRYDFVLQVLMSEMAAKSGGKLKRNEDGSLPSSLNSDLQSSIDVVVNDGDLQNNLNEIDNLLSLYSMSQFSNFERFEKLSKYHDAIMFWQQIFDPSNEKGNDFAELKRKMSVDDYNKFKDLMNEGNFKGMLDLANEILRDIKNGNDRGELFVNAVEEDVLKPQKIQELEKEIQDAKDLTLQSVFDNFDKYSDEKIGDEAKVNEDDVEKKDEIDKIRRVKKIVKSAIDEDEEVLKKINTDFNAIRAEFEEKINAAKEKASAEKKEKFEEWKSRMSSIESFLEDNKNDSLDKELVDEKMHELNNLCTEILSYFGKYKAPITEKFLNTLPLSDDFKESVWKPVKELIDKKKNSKEKRFTATVSIAKQLLENVDFEYSQKEKENIEKLENEYNEWRSKYEDYEEAKKDFDIINEEFESVKASISEKEEEKKRLDESFVGYNTDFRKDLNFSLLIEDLERTYTPFDIVHSDDAETSLRNNFLLNYAQFKSFFPMTNSKSGEKSDLRSSKFLYGVMQASSEARKDIEYLNTFERYNKSLRSASGSLAEEFRSRYYNFINLPEDSIRSAKKKLKVLRRIFKDFIAFESLESFSTKDAEFIWNGSVHEIVLAMNDLEKKISAMQENAAIDKEIELREKARKDSKFIVDVLQSELDPSVYKTFADIEEIEYEKVVKRINELIEKGTIDSEKGNSIIRQLQIERMKYEMQHLNDITKSENEEKDSEEPNDPDKEFDFKNAETNKIYYIDGGESVANVLMSNPNSINPDGAVNISSLGYKKLINRDAKVAYLDENRTVHFYNDNCEEIDSGSFGEVKEDQSEHPEPKSVTQSQQNQAITPEPIQQVNSKPNTQNGFSSNFKNMSESLTKKVQTIEENGTVREVSVVENIILAVEEALRDASSVAELWKSYNKSRRTDNVALDEYVMDKMGLEDISVARHFLDAFAKVVTISPSNEDLYYTILVRTGGNEIFWELAAYYPIVKFKNSLSPKTLFDVRLKLQSVATTEKINYSFGQESAPSSFGNIVFDKKGQAKFVTATEQSMITESENNIRKYGLKKEKNEQNYSGKSGIIVHQGFVQPNPHESKLYARYVDKDGKSLISEEACQSLDNDMVGDIDSYDIKVGFKEIIKYNFGIRDKFSGNVNDETLFLIKIGDNLKDVIKGNIKEGKDIFDGISEIDINLIKNTAIKYALIPILKNGNVIGFLPNNDYFSLNNIKCSTETIGDNSYFTNAAIAESEKRVDDLNNQLQTIRTRCFNENVTITVKMKKDVDNQNGAMVVNDNWSDESNNLISSEAYNSDTDMKTSSSTKRLYLVQNGRNAYGIVPGYQNVDKDGVITKISNENRQKSEFQLKETANPVFQDTKILLTSLVRDVLNVVYTKNPQLLGDLKSSSIEKRLREVFGDKVTDLWFSDKSELVGDISEAFANIRTKILVTCSSPDMKSDTLHSQCNRIIIGSDMSEGRDGKKYYNIPKKGDNKFHFFIGTAEERNDASTERRIVEIPSDCNMTVNDLKLFITMAIGSSNEDFEERLNDFEVAYTSFWKQDGDKTKSYSNTWNRPMLGYSENGEIISTGTTLFNFFKENTLVPIGDFEVDLGEVNPTKLSFKRVNLECVEDIKVDDENKDTEPSETKVEPTNEDMFDVFPENMKENTPPVEKPKSKQEEQLTQEEQDAYQNLTETAENVSFTHSEKWMPAVSDTEEICKSLFRGAINRCILGKNGKSKISIHSITREDLRNAVIDLIREKLAQNEVYIRYFVSKLVKENADKYNTEESLSNGLMTDYPYLNKNIVDYYAKQYFENQSDFSVVKEYNGFECKYIDKVNEELGKNSSIIFSRQYQLVLFDRETGMFQQYISSYINNDNMYILEDQNPFEETQMVDDNGNIMGKWVHSDDNTTAIIDTLSKELRMVLATVTKKKPEYKIINGKEVKTGNSNPNDSKILKVVPFRDSNFGLPLNLQECYDLRDVIDFLSQIGREHKGYTWNSFKEELRNIASKDGEWCGMAASVLEKFETINDPAIIEQFEYKIDDMQSVNFVQVVEYGNGETIEVTESSQKQSLKTKRRSFEEYAMQLISVGNDGDIKIIDDEGNFTNDALDGIYSMNTPSKALSETADFDVKRSTIEKLFKRFLGWIPPYEMYENVRNSKLIVDAYNELIKNVSGNKKVLQPVESKNKKRKHANRDIPVYLHYNNNENLNKLINKSIEYEIMPEGSVEKAAGKNVQTGTARTMATKRLYEMKQKNTELGKKADETIETVGGVKCKRRVQFYGVNRKRYKTGLYNISVYRRSGYMSERMTQLGENDQLYVQTIISANSRDVEENTNAKICDFLGRSYVDGMSYLTVMPDYTDSNKSKSPLWIIPTMSFSFAHDLNPVERNDGSKFVSSSMMVRNGIFDTQNVMNVLQKYVLYTQYSLFDNDLRRIWDIVATSAERKNERMFLSNLAYNTVEITDKDGSKITLAQFFDSVNESNKDEKLSYFKDHWEEISENAFAKTVDIINENLKPLIGLELKFSVKSSSTDKYYNLSVDIDMDAMAKSKWAQCGIFTVNNNIIERNRITNSRNDYFKTIGLADRIDKNEDGVGRLNPIYILAAGIDFICNDIVVKEFLASEMYHNTYDLAEGKIQELDLSAEKTELISGLNKVYDKLDSNTNKRMAGIVTGGNHLDYTRAYYDKDGNIINGYEEWGSADHSKFMYLVCAETEHQVSSVFWYYGQLFYSDLFNKKDSNGKYLYRDKFYNPNTKENRAWIKKNCQKIYGYIDLNSTDGQEFCTWREAIDTLFSQGVITIEYRDKLREVYTKMSNGEKLTEEENDIAKKSLQVFKPIYCGVDPVLKIDGTYGSSSMNYVKSSVAPLLPQFTAGNEFLDNLRKSLESVEKNQKMNVHLAFRSAVKSGGSNDIKNKNGKDATVESVSLNAGNDVDKLLMSCFVADRKYYSIQNETETKIHTKVEKKNKNLRVLERQAGIEKISKGDTENKKYNVKYSLENLKKDLGIDFTNRYIKEKLIDSIVFFGDYKSREESSKYLKNLLRFSNSNEQIIDVVSSWLYDKGKTHITENQLKNLYKSIRESALWGVAYEECRENDLLIPDGSHDENLKIHKKEFKRINDLSVDEKKSLFEKYNLGKYNGNGFENLYKTDDEFDEYLDGFSDVYKMVEDLAEPFIQEYMNVVENPEFTTVELTQFEHMATSGGISKIHDPIFEIDYDSIVTPDIVKYLVSINQINEGDVLYEEKTENGIKKKFVNGINLEKIRTAFEIVENTKEVLNMLFYDLNLITKEQYNTAMKNYSIPKIEGSFNIGSDNMRKIENLVIKELQSRGVNSNAIDMIVAQIPLLLNSELTRVENLLMSIVKKRVSRSYLNGTSFFLMTPYGFGNNQSSKLHKISNKHYDLEKENGVIWIDKERKPGPLRATFESGGKNKKLSMAECAISPQFTYWDKKEGIYKVLNLREEAKDENGKTIMKDGKPTYVYLEEIDGSFYIKKDMLDRNLLEMVTLRVPTSGLMNSCALKIVAFLPESMGGTIIVPQEHIAQFGEDFDIDKRFCYTKAYHINKDGRIVETTDDVIRNFKKDFESMSGKKQFNDIVGSMENDVKSNRKTSLYLSILKCRDSKVQKHINVILNWDLLKETKKHIIETEDIVDERYLAGHGSILNQISLCVKNANAQTGTGTWANTSTYNNILGKVVVPDGYDGNGKSRTAGVVLQQNGFRLNITIDGGRTKPLLFNGDMSSAMTIAESDEKRRTKMEVIAAQLNANLDTVKEDIIAHINQNRRTLPFFTMMAMMGFDTGKSVQLYKRTKNGWNTDVNEYGVFDLASYIAIQPSVVLLSKKEMDRDSVKGDSFRKSKDIIIDILKEMGFTDSDISKMNGSNDPNNELSKFNITDKGVIEIVGSNKKSNKDNSEFFELDYSKIQSQNLYTDHVLTMDDLKKSDNLRMRQLLVLSFFTKVRSLGWQMQKYRTLINTNSTGVGQNFMNVRSHIKKLNDLGEMQFAESPSIKNLGFVIGTFKKKVPGNPPEQGYYDIQGCNFYIKPTTTEGANLLMSLQSANIILGNSLGYMSYGINEIFDELENIYDEHELYDRDRTYYEKRSVKDLQNYMLIRAAVECNGLLKSYDNIPSERVVELERMRLIKADYDDYLKSVAGSETNEAKKKNAINEAKKKLAAFGVDDTFYKQFCALKTSYKYGMTPFFRAMNTMSDNTFMFRLGANDSYEIQRIQNQLSEWFNKDKTIEVNGTKISTKQFVKDIIALSFLMDDKQGINSFRNIIPVDVLNTLGVSESLRKVMNDMKVHNDHCKRFIDWFIINNPRVATVSHDSRFTDYKYGRYTISYKNANDLREYFKNRGIEMPENGNAYPKIFMYENGKNKLVFIFNEKESKNGSLVYNVEKVPEREETGRNYYNPYSNPTESFYRSFRNYVENVNPADITVSFSSVLDTNDVFENISSFLSKKDDPMLTLLKGAIKNKVVGDVSLEFHVVDSGKFNFRVDRSDRKNIKLLYNKNIFENEGFTADEKDQIMHEEIMHIVFGSYLYANAKIDSRGHLSFINSTAEKKLEKAYGYFLTLQEEYKRQVRDGIIEQSPQLNNIFNHGPAENGDLRNFDEFIANIMSANKELKDFIDRFEQYHINDNEKTGIIGKIIQFVVDLFNDICKLSKVHNDVANEVNAILYDMYIDNDLKNLDEDIIEVMKLYQTYNEKPDKGQYVVDKINAYKPRFVEDKNRIRVTDYAHEDSNTDWSAINKRDKELYGYQRNHLGTFMDAALRMAFNHHLSDNEVRKNLENFENPEFFDDNNRPVYYDKPLISFDDKTINMILYLRSKLQAEGGVQEIFTNEITLVSDFKIAGEDKYLKGIPDIVIVSKSGEIEIIDIKTYMREPGHPTTVMNNPDSATAHDYMRQVALYKKLMFEAGFGVDFDEIHCSILEVDYDSNVGIENGNMDATMYDIDDFLKETISYNEGDVDGVKYISLSYSTSAKSQMNKIKKGETIQSRVC